MMERFMVTKYMLGWMQSVLEQHILYEIMYRVDSRRKLYAIVVATLLTRHHQMTLESDYKLLPRVLVRQYYLSSKNRFVFYSNGTGRIHHW